MDSFRLLRYEISAVEHSCQDQNALLRQRHNAAPGMVLVSEATVRLHLVLGGFCSCHLMAAAVLVCSRGARGGGEEDCRC